MRWQDFKNSRTLQFALALQVMAVISIYVETLNSPLATAITGVVVAVLRFATTNSVESKRGNDS